MASFRYLVAALALMILAASAARADEFLSGYEDLPLPPGLAEDVGAGLAFDSPSGRIVEAYAFGPGKPADILKFYSATLPQLGWTRQSDTQYRRESEVLRIDARAERKGTSVHFTIFPE
jgi:hypothetical protein